MITTRGITTFNPQKRFAILVNRWDQVEFFKPPYTQLTPSRGNRTIFEMEAALQRGNLSLIKEVRSSLMMLGAHEHVFSKPPEIDAALKTAHKQLLDECGADIEWRNKLTPRVMQAFSFDDDLTWASIAASGIYVWINPAYYKSDSPINYNPLIKVFPDSNNLRDEVYGAFNVLSRQAEEDSLTLFFIRAHGSPTGVAEFDYDSLIAQLDKIPGKKVIINLCCYSGQLINYIRSSANPSQYAVIASTSADRQGINWNEDQPADDIEELIRSNNPLSELQIKIYSAGGGTQATNIYLPFDIVL